MEDLLLVKITFSFLPRFLSDLLHDSILAIQITAAKEGSGHQERDCVCILEFVLY